MKILIDGDIIAFKSASACESRSIEVRHKSSGKVKVFKNREEFYGRKKNIKGFLGEVNKDRKVPFTLDDFEIKDIQTAETAGTLHRLIDSMVSNLLKKLKFNEFSDEYRTFVGRGKTFREDLATLLVYKNRADAIKPLLLKDAKEYLVKKHNGEFVEVLECDDVISCLKIEGYLQWKRTGENDDMVISVTTDKDDSGVLGWTFNQDADEEPHLIEGFGSLWLTEKGDVKGKGRIWNMLQIAAGDTIDNYKPHCQSDVRWGVKSAYDALKKCKNETEGWQKVVDIYKALYPEPKTIVNFRGDTIEITWQSVLDEISQMAIMRYHPDIAISIWPILQKYKVNID